MILQNAFSSRRLLRFNTKWHRFRWKSALRLLTIICFLVAYGVGAIRLPDGEWDAWAFWNSRARALYYTDYQTAYTQYPAIPHSDYPPLLPLAVAAAWRIAGSTTQLVPVLLHGIIFAALLCIFRARWWTLLLVGGVTLPFATMQYADVALALTFTIAVAGLCRSDERLLAVGAGTGILLKNEGSLLAVSVLVTWLIMWRRVPWRAFLLTLPFAGLLMLHKLIVGTPNDVVGTTGILERVLDPNRYRIILPYVLIGLYRFASRAFLYLLFAAVIYRLNPRRTVPAIAVLLTWLGYIGIYVITPYDLAWHLETSYFRLIMQLFPALVFVVIYATSTTEQVSD